MSDANLITLLEIADEVDVNYRTLISCKREFSDYVFSISQGRINRYPADYKDFFRLIFALKDEGYLTPDIKMMLSKNIPESVSNHLKSWINAWKHKLNNARFRMDGSMDGLTDEGINGLTDEPINGLTEGPMDEWTNGLMDGPTNGPTDELTDEHEPNKSEADHGQFLKQLQENLEDKIESEITGLQQKVESTLSALTPQINKAITQLYKAVTELQLELKDLHKRLAHLEKELGAQPAPSPVLVELDLEAMQISLQEPEPAPLLQHATMDFVKASISDGKPDKQAVVQWIMAERERSPGLSYTDLAEMLDGAGVPTLRGGNGWHRGTIRNLSVK